MSELWQLVMDRLNSAPFVPQRIAQLAVRHGARYHQVVERHLQLLFSHLGRDPVRLLKACDGFLEMTFEAVRMQGNFFRTGKFSLGAEERSTLYTDPELMRDRYLMGLFLAQVFWENHFAKLEFFEERFPSRLAPGSRVLDVGCGPGTYGLLVNGRVAASRVVATDISPLSLELAAGLAAHFPGVDPERMEYRQGDFVERFAASGERFAGVIFSEVVEHLPDPAAGMDVLRELLAPGGVAFFSTATNAWFYDHTMIFRDIDEITALLANHGFTVLEARQEVVFPHPTAAVIDYNAVIAKAE